MRHKDGWSNLVKERGAGVRNDPVQFFDEFARVNARLIDVFLKFPSYEGDAFANFLTDCRTGPYLDSLGCLIEFLGCCLNGPVTPR